MDLRSRLHVKRIAIAVALGVGIGATAAAQGNNERPFSTLRNRGHAVNARLSVMAVRNGLEFVRSTRGEHRNCFGFAKHEVTVALTCWDDFPSPAHPILDESVFGADRGEPLHVIQLQGFAADGVVEIDATDRDGDVLARTPVTDNVYSLDAVPPAAVRIVALDSSGRTVFAVPR
jgi:hypothetical protein